MGNSLTMEEGKQSNERTGLLYKSKSESTSELGKGGRPSTSGSTPETGSQHSGMGSEEDPRDYDQARKLFWYALSGISVVGVIGVTLMYVFLNWNTPGNVDTFTWNSTSNLHIAMMLTFFIFVHGYAVLMFRIFPEKQKFLVKLFHAGVHLSVCIGILIGLASMISYKNATAEAKGNNRTAGPIHFVSLHSWLGLGGIILYYSQYASGFVTFLLPCASGRIRAALLPFHKVGGTVIFIIGTVTALTGYMYKNDAEITPYSMAQLALKFSGVFMVIYAITVIYLVTDHRFRRRPRPEGDILLREDNSGGED